MASQSLLAKLGVRSGTLGTSSSLAIAFPLTEGNPDMAAHTAASRTGWYGVEGTKISHVVNGTEVLTVGASRVTATVPVSCPASTTTSAPLNIGQGSAPTSPVNGDLWVTSGGFFVQIAGSTVGPFSNNPMTTLGDTIYGGISGVQTRLPGNTTTVNKFWTQQGTGAASAAPAWNIIGVGDVPNLPASIITSGVILPANGGTGLNASTAANGTIFIGTGSGLALTTITQGSGIIVTNGAGTITIAATGGGGGTTFLDNVFAVQNVSDATKQFEFSLGGMTTGTVLTLASSQTASHTLNVPNITATDTLATVGLANTFTVGQTISSTGTNLTLSGGATTFSGTQAAQSGVSTRPNAFSLVGGAHTNLGGSLETIDMLLNFARTVQFATGPLTQQRCVFLEAPTYAFVGASTITTAATFAISGPPIAGTNATITSKYALWVQSGTSDFGGLVQTVASTTGTAGLNVPAGAAPTAPVNGDVWTTTSGMFIRINGSTVGPLSSGGGGGSTFLDNAFAVQNAADATKQFEFSLGGMTTGVILTLASTQSVSHTLNVPNITATDTLVTLGVASVFTSKITTLASATGGAGLNLPAGAAPTSPVNGDLWTTTAGIFVQVNGSTVGPLTTGGGGSTFLDNAFAVNNVTDPTKQFEISMGGMTTGTVLTLAGAQSASATLNVPNITTSDTIATLAVANVFTGLQTISTAGAVVGLTIKTTAAAGALTLDGNGGFIRFASSGTVVGTMQGTTTGGLSYTDTANTHTALVYSPGALLGAAWGFSPTTVSTSTGTGAIFTPGGIGFASNMFGGAVAVTTGAPPTSFSFVGGAHTGMSAGNPGLPEFLVDMSQTKQWTGTTGVANYYSMQIKGPTLASTSATTTFTGPATLAILNSPQAGANAVVSGGLAFFVIAGNAQFNGTLICKSAAANLAIAQGPLSSGVGASIVASGGALTGQTAGADVTDVLFNYSHTIQHATGAIATQRTMILQAPTLTAVGASTITTAATLAIVSAPVASTNITITSNYALWVQAGTTAVAASTTTAASINMAPGTAPTSPVNGDLWATTAGVFAQVNGSTVGPFGTGGGGSTFLDNAFAVQNAADATKQFEFSLGGMTTGVILTLASTQSVSHTLNVPNITATDTLVTLGLAQTVTGVISFFNTATITSSFKNTNATPTSAQINILGGTNTTGVIGLGNQQVGTLITGAGSGLFTIADVGNSPMTWLSYADSTSTLTLASAISSTLGTNSTSATTGSLIMSGGSGIGMGTGSIYVNGASGQTFGVTNATANGSVATVLGSLGPVGSSTTVQAWLRIMVAGTARYVPMF